MKIWKRCGFTDDSGFVLFSTCGEEKLMAKSKVKFEAKLARLEQIVEEMEAGDLTLDESLARYEEGVKALKKCYELLRDAEKRVEILLKGENGSIKVEPFEPAKDK